MGQYYKIVNVDKKEYLKPWTFNDGAKLLEFGCSSFSSLTALSILLADGNGRGGGDFMVEDKLVGSWAGDRIVIAGDYADEGKFIEVEKQVREKLIKDGNNSNLYSFAEEHFKDISKKVLQLMLQDDYIGSVINKEKQKEGAHAS
jgi:hypothetical protein